MVGAKSHGVSTSAPEAKVHTGELTVWDLSFKQGPAPETRRYSVPPIKPASSGKKGDCVIDPATRDRMRRRVERLLRSHGGRLGRLVTTGALC